MGLTEKVVAGAIVAGTVVSSVLGVQNTNDANKTPTPDQAAIDVLAELSEVDRKRKDMEGR